MNNIYAMVKQEKKFLLIIFVLAFTVRALFFIFFLSQNNNYWTGDSQEYHNVAQHLALGNGIQNLQFQYSKDPLDSACFSKFNSIVTFLSFACFISAKHTTGSVC